MLLCTSFFAQPMCSSSSPSAARAPPSSKIYCTHTHTTHMRTHKSTRARARTRLKTTPRTNCRLFGGALVRMQTIASHTEIMFTEAARNHGRADRCHRLLRWPSMFIWLVETTPQTAGKVEAADDSHAIGRLMLVHVCQRQSARALRGKLTGMWHACIAATSPPFLNRTCMRACVLACRLG